VETAIMIAGEHHVAGECGRRPHRSADVGLPHLFSVGAVEALHEVAVGAAEVDAAIFERGRCDDPWQAVIALPSERAVRCIDGVELPVARADVRDAVRDRRR